MRILERDKQTIYYANYEGKTEKTKEVDGVTIRLGEYEESYSEQQSAKVYVSTPKGTRQSGFGKATIEPDGIRTSYQRSIISETDLGITEESLIWLDAEPSSDADYRVEMIGKSYHHVTYVVKQIRSTGA